MAFKMKANHKESEKTKEDAKQALDHMIDQISDVKTKDSTICVGNLIKLKGLLEEKDGEVAKFSLKLNEYFKQTKVVSDIKMKVITFQIATFLKEKKLE